MKPHTLFLALLLCINTLFPLHASELEVITPNPVMPALQGIHNTIHIRLHTPRAAGNIAFRGTIAADSGLLLSAAHANPAKTITLLLRPEETLTVQYLWDGPVPVQKAHKERITVSVPDLGLEKKLEFSVGMNLQIASVNLPSQPERSSFLPIRIFLRDTFHPKNNTAETLRAWGIQPKLRLLLVDAHTGKPAAAKSHDPVLTRFFGSSRIQQSTAWPFIASSASGSVLPAGEGKWAWENAAGEQQPGFIQPEFGQYRVQAFLWPQTGFPGIQNASSDIFTITADDNRTAEPLPHAIASTLQLLRQIHYSHIQGVGNDIRECLSHNDLDEAGKILGRHVRGAFSSDFTTLLGRYADTLLFASPNSKETLRFFRFFLEGYGGHGLFIFTNRALVSATARTLNGSPFSQTSTPITPQGNPVKARIYRGPQFTVIPFVIGDVFITQIESTGKQPTDLWKIMPQGIHSKTYPAEKWEKAVTVYGDRLLPPPPQR